MGANRVITLQYEDLVAFDTENPNETLIGQVKESFGPQGLGILAVDGIPKFGALRSALLPLAAQLPEKVDGNCIHEKSKFSVGWSYGKEELSPGKPDFGKGSYYGNPLVENWVKVLTNRDGREDHWKEQSKLYPEFYADNIWPERLPELQQAFCELGQCIAAVGRLLAVVCDAYCRKEGVETNLAGILTKSLNAKGRLLHYYDRGDHSEGDNSIWCGLHNDHGSLTGLVPAMYFDNKGKQVPCPDAAAGLYIRSRSGETVHVNLPPTACGFQIGETSQIQSGGLLQATPHFVQSTQAGRVTRESFAVFLEPEFEDPLFIPEGKSMEDCSNKTLPKQMVPLCSRWKPGQTFGEFHVATVTAFTNCSTPNTAEAST